jgi:hypothetical protein
MKNLILLLVVTLSCLVSKASTRFEPPKTQTAMFVVGSFTWILTHANGNKLKSSASFTVNSTTGVTTLKGNGVNNTYYIKRSLGGMCGMYGKDKNGRSMSICITPLGGKNTEVEIKFSNETITFTGYKL